MPIFHYAYSFLLHTTHFKYNLNNMRMNKCEWMRHHPEYLIDFGGIMLFCCIYYVRNMYAIVCILISLCIQHTLTTSSMGITYYLAYTNYLNSKYSAINQIKY